MPMGARIRLPEQATAEAAVDAALKFTGPDRTTALVHLNRVLNALYIYGGYVTTTAQPTTHPAGRMTFGLTDDYLTADERRALTAALQGATWEVIVDE